MNGIVSGLLDRFDKGALTRRDLMHGLAVLSAAAGTSAVAQPQDDGLKSVKIDHVSIQVSDLAGSVAFYEKMFGLKIVGEDKPNEIVRLGVTKALVSLHHKAPFGVVDHFAIAVDKFNRDSATKSLKDRGADSSENLDAGFHIVDPQGIGVQIVGA